MDAPVTNFVLVAPEPTNPFTGGHLYNGRIASLAGLAIVRVPADGIDDWLRGRERPCVLDSLYLTSADPALLTSGPPLLQLAHYLPDRAPNADPALGAVVGRALQSARGVVATSEYTAAQARESQPSTLVCHPGVDPFASRPKGAESDTPVVLSVANFEARKGHRELLTCLARLEHLPWTWEIVGDTGAEPETWTAFERELESSGLTARVRIHGRQPPEFTRAKMLEADIFALLTSYEPYGMVFAESVSAGLPVIAWSTGGIGESVEDGATGYLVRPGDDEVLTRRLENLLVSRETRLRMSESCRRVAFPTWEQAAARFVACVDELLRDDPR